MDEERMMREFSFRCHTKIGLRYMVINTGRRGIYDPNAKLPRAIHIEVAEDQAARVSGLLHKDYASNQEYFPIGMKMRFVPDINQLMNYGTRSKSVLLATRQLAFEEKMGYVNSWEIADLYSQDKSNNDICLA